LTRVCLFPPSAQSMSDLICTLLSIREADASTPLLWQRSKEVNCDVKENSAAEACNILSCTHWSLCPTVYHNPPSAINDDVYLEVHPIGLTGRTLVIENAVKSWISRIERNEQTFHRWKMATSSGRTANDSIKPMINDACGRRRTSLAVDGILGNGPPALQWRLSVSQLGNKRPRPRRFQHRTSSEVRPLLRRAVQHLVGHLVTGWPAGSGSIGVCWPPDTEPNIVLTSHTWIDKLYTHSACYGTIAGLQVCDYTVTGGCCCYDCQSCCRDGLRLCIFTISVNDLAIK